MKKKILFISHDATRTGAPILLINLAKILKANGYAIGFLLKYGGPLEYQFSELGEECVIAHRPSSVSLFSRLKKRIFQPKPFFDLRQLNWEDYSLILSNTITNGDILPLIREKYKGKIMSYVHELQMATNFFTNSDNVQALLKCTDHFMVPSIAVKDHLISNLEILPSKISVVNYFIPASSIINRDLVQKSTFNVGGAGTTDWRKGPDLFIHVALTVFKKLPDAKIHFLWKGAAENHFETKRLLYDINKAGLEGKVTILPVNSEMDRFYSTLDLFLLSSREDPFPLVLLEAAGSGIPSVCFDNSGGAIEFINESGGGLTVPYLDIEEMANKVIYYYEYPDKRESAGRSAKNHLINRHQNQKYIFDQFEHAVRKENGE